MPTITWLGYDAPQDPVKDAPFERYAYDGAPAYRQFMDGLDASHSGPGEPHRTAIGHSYGTTLIGAAAEEGKIGGGTSPGSTALKNQALVVVGRYGDVTAPQ